MDPPVLAATSERLSTGGVRAVTALVFVMMLAGSAGVWRASVQEREALERCACEPAARAALAPDRSALVLAGGLLASLVVALATFGLLRRAQERATAREAARRRVLFDASPDGMVVLDPATARILEFNTAAHVQLGYSREAFARLQLREIEAMETEEERRRRIDEVLERGRSDYETLHRTRGGDLRDIHVTAQVIQAGGQQVYQCVWRDVTERRRAELALREAHERLRRLGDNLPGGYVYQVVLAPDGARRFTYASAGVEQVHGVTVADALRDPGTIYGLSPEAEQRRIRGLEERSARELTPFTAEVEVRSPTGGVQWLQLSAAPGQLADGSIRWDGIALDVTGRHRMEADRLVASKLESTGILAGGLAHDFNNLLTTMLMGVELARMDGGGGQPGGDPLDEVVAAVMAARDLTQQLITFSRGGAPVRRVTEVDRVVRDSTSLALTGANVTRRLVFEPGLWTAELDEGQFAQVVRNLVLNAREAMPAGGIVTVTLRNARLGAASGPGPDAGDCVELVVADTGAGISPEALPRIFDPYFSTKHRGAQKGMGLGLTICHSVVRKHGGAINVDSTPGQGTRVRVLLPASPGVVVVPDGPTTPLPSRVRRGRVLVMDDEEPLRRNVAYAIEQLGCAVVTAAEGGEAAARWGAARQAGEPFDLAVLDLTVREGAGGLEALRRIREQDPAAKAVLMSGFTDSDALKDPTAHGFEGSLQKPFGLTELRALLARCLPG